MVSLLVVEPNGEGMLEAAVSEHILVRAGWGDADGFQELVDPYRGELQLRCYRIVGSLEDSEDLLQETLLAAWRGLGHFKGRASLRATAQPPEPTRLSEPIWLEPYPDVLLVGLILFSGASLLAGLAQSQELLIEARALQGFGAARARGGRGGRGGRGVIRWPGLRGDT
jgi:Sigma-70 region 2